MAEVEQVSKEELKQVPIVEAKEEEKISDAPAEVKTNADDQAEDKDATAPLEEEVKTPFKVPTLYVRNLNDKTKVEGK